jgi:hypothetical protein
MRTFLIKTAFISLPVILLALGMELLLRNIPNDYVLKRSYLESHADEIEVLILGSSHSFYGLDPALFTSRAFNAGNISQSPDYDLEIVKRFGPSMTNLRYLILPMSYSTPFARLKKGEESWRVKNYGIYYGIRKSWSPADYSEFLSNRLDINMRRLRSYYVDGVSPVTTSELGWGTNYASSEARDLERTGKKAAMRHSREDLHSGENQAVIRENTAILSEMTEWASARGVRVLIVTAPAFETYRIGLSEEQLELMERTAQNVISGCGNCRYVNLLSDTSYVAEDFFDADHLSEIGARKYSLQINALLENWE